MELPISCMICEDKLSTVERIRNVASRVWPESVLTSAATTAKPRPASPAREASIVALSARRLVCWAIFSIALETPPTSASAFSTSDRRCSMVPVVSTSSDTRFMASAMALRQSDNSAWPLLAVSCAIGSGIDLSIGLDHDVGAVAQRLELTDLAFGFSRYLGDVGCGLMQHEAEFTEPATDGIDQRRDRVGHILGLRR